MTGALWAPHLPDGWRTGRLRWLAQIYAGGTPDKSNLEFWTDGTIPWLNSGSVNDWVITAPSAFITNEAYASSSAQWVPAKSVVIALAGQGRTKGLAARTEMRATTNQSMAAIVPGKDLEYRFLQYWLTSNYHSVRNLAGGDLRDGLNLQHIASIECPLPPLGEQRRIADFLDAETAQIDTLIGEQERFIELLRERRDAAISDSVIGGSRSISDSDQLSKALPAGWTVMPFLRCMTGQVDYRGATPTKTAEGVQLITARNVKQGWIDYRSSQEFVSRDDYGQIMHRGLPHVGDLLFTMEAPLGNVALVDREDIALAQRIVKFEVNRSIADPEFLCFAAQGRWFQSQLAVRATGSTALGIKASKLPELRIALPGLDEQVRISAHLDELRSHIEVLVAEAEHNIALSKERRAALITAAVIGQIDVSTGRVA